MPGNKGDTVSINKSFLIGLLIIAVVIILGLSGWIWLHSVYEDQQNVFWGMIDNNLATSSITRHVTQKSQAQSLNQSIQLVFGKQMAAHSLITLEQTGTTAAVVKSETIGLAKTDYNRYLGITTSQKTTNSKPLKTSNLIGVWAKTTSTGTAQYLSQSVFTIVPYGNFPSETRSSLVQCMKGHNVYSIESAKTETINNRSVFTYQTNISPPGYITCMNQYIRDLGLGDSGLNPAQYQNSAPLQVNFSVAKLSRQLMKIVYPSSQQQSETFASQGLEIQVAIPTKTIPLSELQSRITASLQ